MAFQNRKVAVLGLTSNITKLDLSLYFSNFGLVEEVVIKACHKYANTFFAFVRFSNQAGVEAALAMAPHMIKMRIVRVCRARPFCPTVVSQPLPATLPSPPCPFPGMDLVRKCFPADLGSMDGNDGSDGSDGSLDVTSFPSFPPEVLPVPPEVLPVPPEVLLQALALSGCPALYG